MDKVNANPTTLVTRKTMAATWPNLLFLAVLLPGLAIAQMDDAVKFHHADPGPQVDYQALLEEATPLSDSPEGQELLQACLDAYGGMEKAESLRTFKLTYPEGQEGELGKPTVEKFFSRDRRYKIQEGDKERMINGSTCWVQSATDSWEMEGFRYRAELYSYLVLAMPFAAKTEHFDEVKYSRGEVDNLGIFYFVKTDSLMITMGVDTANHTIQSTTGILTEDEKTMVYINKFDDYRLVEGFLFPHQLTNYSLGMKMGELFLEGVEINPEFPDSVFLPRADRK